MIKKYIKDIITPVLTELEFPEKEIILDIPKEEKHGDFSTNIALLVAKELKKNPKEISQSIIDKILIDKKFISKIEIAGPGFINFFISDEYYFRTLINILEQKDNYGKSQINKSKKANLEWVSANPTGPLHAGHGRQVCLGKAIANLLEWTGYNVTREYYYNDAGNQMNKLAKSVYSRYMQIFEPEFPFPDDGYNGEYIQTIALKIFYDKGDEFKNSTDLSYFKSIAEKENFSNIKNSLQKFDIKHNVFFNESDLYKNGNIGKLLKIFEEKDLIYEKDGAVFLKMEKDKFQKDKVIVKSSSEPTYRLPDMAYHIDKIERGFDKIIDIFGSDHGDTYKEVLFGINQAGYNIEKIKVIIHQMVTFKKGDKSVKMSKRSDEVYYLDDLVSDVGIDATQFFFVMRAANTHLDFDIELAKEQSDKNPVYYLQYAFARICGILRNAEENFKHYKKFNLKNLKFDLINSFDELLLLKKLSLFPFEVTSSAATFEPHKIIIYLNSLAEIFHRFYHNKRVLDMENEEQTISRLQICLAVKQVLKNGFHIIGITAPERM